MLHFLFQNFFLKLTCQPSDHYKTSALTFYVAIVVGFDTDYLVVETITFV